MFYTNADGTICDGDWSVGVFSFVAVVCLAIGKMVGMLPGFTKFMYRKYIDDKRDMSNMRYKIIESNFRS